MDGQIEGGKKGGEERMKNRLKWIRMGKSRKFNC